MAKRKRPGKPAESTKTRTQLNNARPVRLLACRCAPTRSPWAKTRKRAAKKRAKQQAKLVDPSLAGCSEQRVLKNCKSPRWAGGFHSESIGRTDGGSSEGLVRRFGQEAPVATWSFGRRGRVSEIVALLLMSQHVEWKAGERRPSWRCVRRALLA